MRKEEKSADPRWDRPFIGVVDGVAVLKPTTRSIEILCLVLRSPAGSFVHQVRGRVAAGGEACCCVVGLPLAEKLAAAW